MVHRVHFNFLRAVCKFAPDLAPADFPKLGRRQDMTLVSPRFGLEIQPSL